MTLESYICENCILQRTGTAYHLFLRYNFIVNYWNSIGVVTSSITCPQRAIQRIRTATHPTPCAMEIVILMAWSI
jgi:hypothetical protein